MKSLIISFLLIAAASLVAEPSPQITRHSLFNVSSEWQNQHGKTLPLSQLHGKVQVVAMVYTSCQYACPRILAELKNIEKALADYSTEDLGICIVTF